MFIKQIQVENYRSCLNTKFDLDRHFSVLIGPNGSGKTNMLNAILLLKKLISEGEYYYRHEEEQPAGQCKLKVWFDINGRQIILTSKIDIYTDEENRDIIVSSKQKWYLKDFTGSPKHIELPLEAIKEMITEKRHPHFYPHKYYLKRRYKSLRRVHRSLRGLDPKTIKPFRFLIQYVIDMKYYSASQFTNPSDCPVSFEIEKEGRRRRRLGLKSHSKFLYDIYIEYKTKETSRYNQFFDIIGPAGIRLVDSISFNEIETSSTDYLVRSGGKVRKSRQKKILVIPKFKIDKYKLSPNQLSEGTLRTITLLFYLITEKSSLLLIEEPEVCVHHGLLSSIVGLIKTYSRDKQIVISTHSDFVLDKVKPENVYRVLRMPKKGTKITHIAKAMSKKELIALRNYLENEGNLGEYWKHGALV